MAWIKERKGKKRTTYYLVYRVGDKEKVVKTKATNYQMAKSELGQLERSFLEKADLPFPTETPLATMLQAYTVHLRTAKSGKNAAKVISVLRNVFGPVCDGLKVKNEKIREQAVNKKKTSKDVPPIQVNNFEDLTTYHVATFIQELVRRRRLTGKTANRYREVVTRLCNWATSQYGIRMPGKINPAAKVEKYDEVDPEIIFLNLDEIDEQLEMLSDYQQLQTMAALYIYAGLRREEAVWLRATDVDLSAGEFGIIHVRAKTVNGKPWKPKNKKNRVVPVSSDLRRYLDNYTSPPSDFDWFFPSPEGNWWDPDNFSHKLSDANSQFDLKWGCDEYRHTFGSQLAMKGESLYKISELMGNSPEICRKHYARLMPESLVNSVEFPRRKPATPSQQHVQPDILSPPTGNMPRLRLVVNNGRNQVMSSTES